MFRWIKRLSSAKASRQRIQAGHMPRQLKSTMSSGERAYRDIFGETVAEREARRIMQQMSRSIGGANPTGLTPVPLSNTAQEVYNDATPIYHHLNDSPAVPHYAGDVVANEVSNDKTDGNIDTNDWHSVRSEISNNWDSHPSDADVSSSSSGSDGTAPSDGS